jgi:hypothetical protein
LALPGEAFVVIRGALYTLKKRCPVCFSWGNIFFGVTHLRPARWTTTLLGSTPFLYLIMSLLDMAFKPYSGPPYAGRRRVGAPRGSICGYTGGVIPVEKTCPVCFSRGIWRLSLGSGWAKPVLPTKEGGPLSGPLLGTAAAILAPPAGASPSEAGERCALPPRNALLPFRLNLPALLGRPPVGGKGPEKTLVEPVSAIFDTLRRGIPKCFSRPFPSHRGPSK